jgi:hypothetical protein
MHAITPSSDVDTARRLPIDRETLLPRRFEYTYGFRTRRTTPTAIAAE